MTSRMTSNTLAALLASLALTACQPEHVVIPADPSDGEDMQTLDMSDATVGEDASFEDSGADPRDMNAPEDMTSAPEDLGAPTADADMGRVVEMGPEDMQVALPENDPPSDRPLRLLFLGNSFTHQGPVPHIVRDLATDAGWPTPNVEFVAPGGRRLSYHRTNQDSLDAVDQGNWDVVVLQEFSTGPTDNLGDPAQFKENATWFFDRIMESSPNARVVLYMTWARHPDHSYYPNSFADPEEMQAQLRFHYNDAADNYIPANATHPVTEDNLAVAPVGDAWERHLARPDAERLHGSDDYHAGLNGRYLNALVIYGTIYNRATYGLVPIDTSVEGALKLQEDADFVTEKTVQGGPDGTFGSSEPALEVGQTILVDLGDASTQAPSPWNNLTYEARRLENASDTRGTVTRVDFSMTDNFAGANPNGLDNNQLGYPAQATTDTFWIGSFDGHTAALSTSGQITLRHLDPEATYALKLFAARSGDDSGRGRLTRFIVNGQQQDLEVADNTSNTADFLNVTPDALGQITIDVRVSPEGGSRFGYLGTIQLTREQ